MSALGREQIKVRQSLQGRSAVVRESCLQPFVQVIGPVGLGICRKCRRQACPVHVVEPSVAGEPVARQDDIVGTRFEGGDRGIPRIQGFVADEEVHLVIQDVLGDKNAVFG